MGQALRSTPGVKSSSAWRVGNGYPRLVTRQVKGSLFVDYVRMLRMRKDVDWSRRLDPEDLPFLAQRVEPDRWYPMETFERMGLAILNVIANGDLELVRGFGKASLDWLSMQHPQLLAEHDPRESLMRFHVMRQSFFSYPALQVTRLTEGEATLAISYRMGDVAEEAAALQTLGFFERLLELAGATTVLAKLSRKRWEGDPGTVLELRWR